MTRPVRYQYAGAIYHVTSRGDRKRGIYADDKDRLVWSRMLGQACVRYNLKVYSYCQMGNHYHLLLETTEPNLSAGLQHLNGNYSAYFNRRHKLVGHVFQGRYKAILCDAERYLLELARYIVLNPVRARMVRVPEQWWWSSHLPVMGLAEVPDWLDTNVILSRFGPDAQSAIPLYREFVLAGIGRASPLLKLQHQAVLGDDDFVQRVTKGHAMPKPGISRVQRRLGAQKLDYYFERYRRDEAIVRAYRTTLYSMREIAEYCQVSTRTVSRAIKAFEMETQGGQATIWD